MEPESVGDSFASLYQLIVQGSMPLSRMAALIERQGISGVDRFGRLVQYAADSPQAARALDALAAQHLTVQRPLEPDAIDRAEWEWVFDNFGWPLAAIEDVGSPLPGDAPQQAESRAATAKRATNELRLIGALLAFIRGEYTERQHPAYESDAKLQELLHIKVAAAGFSPRHLQSVFSRAKQALAEATSDT
jgi:hypothetical protein